MWANRFPAKAARAPPTTTNPRAKSAIVSPVSGITSAGISGPAPKIFPPNRVEKIATVDTEFARAQLPVGSQQKMVTEHAVLLAVQRAPGNETEIGDKFLVFTPPCGRALAARVRPRADRLNTQYR